MSDAPEIDANAWAFTLLCFEHDEDERARYRLKRVVECVVAVASTFHKLKCLNGRDG
jgi:hypothetical protein